MKRWEVAKGVAEGKFEIGTRFQVAYPDGDVGEAYIDATWTLRWEEGGHALRIVAYNEDEWTVIKEEVEEEEVRFSVKQSHLDYLEGRQAFLECLEHFGVKSWEWFDEAVKLYDNEYAGKTYIIE